MEGAQAVRTAVWRSWPGTILLYGALATHVGFALSRLVMRRTWRMPTWVAAEIGLAAAGGSGATGAGAGDPAAPGRSYRGKSRPLRRRGLRGPLPEHSAAAVAG